VLEATRRCHGCGNPLPANAHGRRRYCGKACKATSEAVAYRKRQAAVFPVVETNEFAARAERQARREAEHQRIKARRVERTALAHARALSALQDRAMHGMPWADIASKHSDHYSCASSVRRSVEYFFGQDLIKGLATRPSRSPRPAEARTLRAQGKTWTEVATILGYSNAHGARKAATRQRGSNSPESAGLDPAVTPFFSLRA
jgi:hypothetical protein